jgi:8-oxo-dGTP diphosphatase
LHITKNNGFIFLDFISVTIVEKIKPFLPNDETSEIVLWDLKDDIGTIDETDYTFLTTLSSELKRKLQ